MCYNGCYNVCNNVCLCASPSTGLYTHLGLWHDEASADAAIPVWQCHMRATTAGDGRFCIWLAKTPHRINKGA